jgi:lipopolysaccharide/colanic/teichoic acid biosynthesis glycosyltransferase
LRSKYGQLAADVLLLALATVIAFIVRDNFEVAEDRLLALFPYLAATVVLSAVIFSATGLNRSIWRFTGLADYIRVAWAVLAVAVGATAVAFAVNRMGGVPRALPVMQAMFGIFLLVGVRVLMRQRYQSRSNRAVASKPLALGEEALAETVLVVGVGRLAEAYLNAAQDLAANRVRIAGIAGLGDRHAGRLVATHPVLGAAEELDAILDELEVHGVAIDRIVVAAAFADLSQEARDALFSAESERAIKLQFLAADLGFERPADGTGDDRPAVTPSGLSFEISAGELDRMADRPYWALKRMIDAALALVLILLLSPLMLLVALLVSMTIGQPITFWQQRPGLGGRPFRLYKFRTMSAAHAADGRKLSDAERVSRLGDFLRRTRLDELPQLVHILMGRMSFVGPRPLLPRDQSEAYRARLLVRPGLTGWAQVIGGREVSAEDKAALDIWYVRNACFRLDFEIALRTIPMVVRGERMDEEMIGRAWRDLHADGILRGGGADHPRLAGLGSGVA